MADEQDDTAAAILHVAAGVAARAIALDGAYFAATVLAAAAGVVAKAAVGLDGGALEELLDDLTQVTRDTAHSVTIQPVASGGPEEIQA